jgi:hypothetical protein
VRRFFGLAAVLVALSLALPIGASAGPQGTRVPPGTVIGVFPAGQVCPDALGEVTWTVLSGQESYVDKPDGRLMAGLGTAQWEVRSAATGKAVVLKTAGKATYSALQPDGTYTIHASGQGFFGFFPGDVGPGDQTAGRTFLFKGTQKGVNTTAGATIEFRYSGQIVMDVCAAIS